MSLQLHDNEGCLFLNEDGRWTGQFMAHGITFNMTGEVGVSPRGKTYMQLRARERAKLEVRPSPPPRVTRSSRLEWALREVESKYGRKP